MGGLVIWRSSKKASVSQDENKKKRPARPCIRPTRNVGARLRAHTHIRTCCWRLWMSSLAGPSTFRRFVLRACRPCWHAAGLLQALFGHRHAHLLSRGRRPQAPRPPRGGCAASPAWRCPGRCAAPGEGVGTVVRARGVLLMFSSNNPTQIQNGLFELNPNPYNSTVHKSTIDDMTYELLFRQKGEPRNTTVI